MVDKDGYGKFQVTLGGDRQRSVRAHRYAFELEHGRVPIGVLRHQCDRPRCVRPDHLVEGTQAQNRADTVVRGREPRGSTKPNAVLTESIVAEARARAEAGESVASLARVYGVPYGPLYAAVRGKMWRHV
jgi:hypothetical protein